MAYTGIMGQVGFDLVCDTVKYLTNKENEIQSGKFFYDANYIFLRDVDEQPIVLKQEPLFT